MRALDPADLRKIAHLAGHLGAKQTERATIELLYLNADLDPEKAGERRDEADRR